MSDKIALMISVRDTLLNYDNRATSGADVMANGLRYALRNAFYNVRMVQDEVTADRAYGSMLEVSENLKPGGFALIYFHGHGDSVGDQLEPDETSDQALVCYDRYIIDDQMDEFLRNFDPTCRLMTIMDSCSSETVVEWKYHNALYPQVIHIGAASDNGYAYSGPSGGFLSQEIINLIYDLAYTQYTYQTFLDTLQQVMSERKFPIFIRKNQNVTNEYLSQPLFT